MNFLALGKALIDLGMPVLGAVLGVPELAPAAADLIKDALGLPSTATNEQIATAAQSADPEVRKAIEATAAEKWKAIAALAESTARQTEAINTSIQAETVANVSFLHWRHLIGYVTGAWIVAPLPFICIAMYVLVTTGKADVLNAIIAALGGMTAWVGIAAGLNGFIAQDTTKRTTSAMAGEPVTGIIGGLIKAVTQRKK